MNAKIELIEIEESLTDRFRTITFWYTKRTKIGVVVYKRNDGSYDLFEWAAIPLPEGSDRLFNDEKKLTDKQRETILQDILDWYWDELEQVELESA